MAKVTIETAKPNTFFSGTVSTVKGTWKIERVDVREKRIQVTLLSADNPNVEAIKFRYFHISKFNDDCLLIDSIVEIKKEDFEITSPFTKPECKVKLEIEFEDPTVIDILHRVKAGIRNIWMVGPAGSGKSTIAEKVAHILKYEMYTISCGLGTSASEFIGYKYPQREKTPFSKHYVIPSVILLDEFTSLDPAVAQVANGALANGRLEITTLDEITQQYAVERHSDCIIIATSNTFGTGANPQYVSNNQLDASTRDRFTGGIIYVDYNVEYEAANYDSEVVNFVWLLREHITNKRLQRIASTRMIQAGHSLKKSGKPDWRRILIADWTKAEIENLVETARQKQVPLAIKS